MVTAMNRRALIAFSTLLVFAGTRAAWAASTSFKVPLTGAQCVPAVDTSGTGTADLTYDPATRVVTWNITYSGLSSPVTMAHFHGPAKQGQNAPVVIWLTSKTTPPSSPITGSATLTPEQTQ